MRPQLEVREAVLSKVLRSGSFGVNPKNLAHVFHILRNQLYSNKILAVLREYCANAWDEHRAAGCPDRPIKVILPTDLDPVLRIRDYGRGLTEDEIFDFYTQYGSSSKREDDDTVGSMGNGCKSGFAYTDSFTVTSWRGGQKSIYQAVIGESNIGDIYLMWSGPCENPEETGLEISLSIPSEDHSAFLRESRTLLPFFKPLPEVNFEIPELKTSARFPEGALLEQNGGWYALMGCIPYPIARNQLRRIVESGFENFVDSTSGVLHFDIGEVSVAASREELEYTPKTCDAIDKKLRAYLSSVTRSLEEYFARDTISNWERRRKAVSNRELLSEKLQAEWDEWGVAFPTQFGEPLISCNMKRKISWQRKQYFDAETTLEVSKDARIVLADAKPSLRYSLGSRDYLLVPEGEVSNWAAFEAALEKHLKSLRLDGIPLVRLSTLTKDSPNTSSRKASTPTHPKNQNYFILKDILKTGIDEKGSKNWALANREPCDKDVFVVLESFCPHVGGSAVTLDSLRSDFRALEWLGLNTPPEIVGHRSTQARPVVEGKLLGRDYLSWRQATIKKLLEENPDKQAQVSIIQKRRDPLATQNWRWSSSKNALAHSCVEKLGASHPLTQHVVGIIEAQGRLRPPNYDLISHVVNLMPYERQDFLASYPLLRATAMGDSALLCIEHLDDWLHYIQLIDASRNTTQPKENL